MEETTNRMYELGFILVPTTVEGAVPEEAKVLSDMIEKLGGVIASSGAPEFIDLAYQMEQSIGGAKRKWTQGYFGWFKFELDPSATEALKKGLDANFTIIRYILIKTNVLNTVVFKKPKVDPKRFSTEDVIDEEALEAQTLADEAEAEANGEKLEHEKLPDLAAEVAEDSTSIEG